MVQATLERGTRSVTATVNYIARIGEPLYNYYFMDPPPGKTASNEVREPREVTIASLREATRPPTLDREGFQLIPFTTACRDIYDPAECERVFFAEAAAAIRRVTGAVETRVFDPFLRGPEAQRRAPGSITAPAPTVHVDFTNETGPEWFDDLLGPEADRWRGHDYALINLWRPITGPLQDHPLALCDASSVDPADLMTSESYSLVSANGLHAGEGELQASAIYSTAFNPAHRWFYVPDMMPDEALLLKNYDSRENGIARFSPHCAFADPTTPPDAPPRASIEVRVLAVF